MTCAGQSVAPRVKSWIELNFDGVMHEPIYQGTDWDGFRVRFDSQPSTDPLAQIRTGDFDRAGKLIETMQSEIDPDSGGDWWHFFLDDQQTTALPLRALVFDVDLTDGNGKQRTPIRGLIVVQGEITRA